MSKNFNPAQASTRELFTVFGAVLNELKARGVTRSTNNPIADYASCYLKRLFGLSVRRDLQLVMTQRIVRVSSMK